MSSLHNALLLRVELKSFKPAIYREVLVDPNITLRTLHTVIQAAMGWENAHLYAFAQPLRSTEPFWKIPNQRKWQKPNPDAWGEPMGNDAKVRLSQLLTAPKQRLLYLYDFGDEWLHTHHHVDGFQRSPCAIAPFAQGTEWVPARRLRRPAGCRVLGRRLVRRRS